MLTRTWLIMMAVFLTIAALTMFWVSNNRHAKPFLALVHHFYKTKNFCKICQISTLCFNATSLTMYKLWCLSHQVGQPEQTHKHAHMHTQTHTHTHTNTHTHTHTHTLTDRLTAVIEAGYPFQVNKYNSTVTILSYPAGRLVTYTQKTWKAVVILWVGNQQASWYGFLAQIIPLYSLIKPTLTPYR